MKIGIIVAMDKDLQQLQQLFTDGNVLVRKCGIGKVNAALGAQQMINEFPPTASSPAVVRVAMATTSKYRMS